MTPDPWTTPVILQGTLVRLEPLELRHVEPLTAVALEPSLWRIGTVRLENAADVRHYVEIALDERERGASIPFATVDRQSGRVVGSTRFANISRHDRRVEIGWTWLHPRWQRTGLNREAKLLMLQHAFEVLGCVRVELKTDVRNAASRTAMLRLGAREEGVFRKHMRLADGTVRDTVWYAIIDDEWPAVRDALTAGLRR